MSHQPQNNIDRGYTTSDFEIRKTDEPGAPFRLRGYALRFGSVYDMGWFTEEVGRNALDNADLSDVRILLDHDSSIILGRTSAGTASVGVDDRGMWYEVDLPDSPNGQNARVAVERRDITQSSWGFRLRVDATGRSVGSVWEMRNGKEHRTLVDVSEVLDASLVAFPANPDTTIAKRSLEDYRQAQIKEPVNTDIYNMVNRVLSLKQRHLGQKQNNKQTQK